MMLYLNSCDKVLKGLSHGHSEILNEVVSSSVKYAVECRTAKCQETGKFISTVVENACFQLCENMHLNLKKSFHVLICSWGSEYGKAQNKQEDESENKNYQQVHFLGMTS